MLLVLSPLCLFGLHRRSKRGRFRDRDGLMKSECRHCGVRMLRERESGRWLAHGSRDLRAQTAPVRAWLDRMTGPVLFLMALAALLGLTLWLHGGRSDDDAAANKVASARAARSSH